MQPCQTCFHCTRRKPLLCGSLTAFGGNVPGGFAEYCRYPARLVSPIGDLPDLEAVLVEPAACATHGIERMQIEVGSKVLLFGCGPTGMLLAQLIRMNGAAHVRQSKWEVIVHTDKSVDNCFKARTETFPSQGTQYRR